MVTDSYTSLLTSNNLTVVIALAFLLAALSVVFEFSQLLQKTGDEKN